MRCDYCYSEGKCYRGCECSKCVDEEDYSNWKRDFPEEYDNWIKSKREEEENESDYDKELAEMEEREFLDRN